MDPFPQNHNIYIIASFLFSLLVCYRLIPKVIDIAKIKKLYDEPNNRSAHTIMIPSLGGVAIFVGFSLSLLIFSNGLMGNELKYIIAATLIMFGLGIKDDLAGISPRKKLVGQIFAALIVIVLGDIRFTNLHGMLGIYQINYFLSVALTIFTIIVITNGFNLIDGIDGLASGISGLCTLSLGVWFFITGNYDYAVLAAGLLGSLVAFFYFNVFGKKNKIFMGDTGSLILGLIISIFIIEFNEINIRFPDVKYAVRSAPAISFGILIVPLIDTISIMYIRVKKGKSPFRPDKNHVHHRMLTLGYRHVGATVRIMAVNAIFILLAFFIRNLGNMYIFIIEISLGILFYSIPSYLIRIRVRQRLLTRPSKRV